MWSFLCHRIYSFTCKRRRITIWCGGKKRCTPSQSPHHSIVTWDSWSKLLIIQLPWLRLFFCTRRLLLSGTIGLYRKRSRSLYVCLCVGDLSVTASLCTNHEILCLLCVFHVLVVKLETWNFVYAFLTSIPTCMHGFMLIRILLIPKNTLKIPLKHLNFFPSLRSTESASATPGLGPRHGGRSSTSADGKGEMSRGLEITIMSGNNYYVWK